MSKPAITDPRFSWINARKHFDKYGKLEVGQRVKLVRTMYAPTNSLEQLHWFKRDESGEVVDCDPTVELATEHDIVDLRDSESGVFVLLRDDLGCLLVPVSNAYGQTNPGFISVLRDVPKQREIAAC